MATNRADRRRQTKVKARPRVYVPVPEEFVDATGHPWTSVNRDGDTEDFDLPEVLTHTLRQAPTKSMDDAKRALDVFRMVEQADGYIEMPKDDWDWMMGHLNDVAHKVWKSIEGAYLVNYLEAAAQTKPPKEEGNGDDDVSDSP
jgi:hypothetical protein